MTYPPEKTPVATALGPATARSAYRLPRPAGVEPRWHHLAGPSCRQLGASLALALSLASVGWADDTPLTTPATAPGATGTVTIRLQLSPSSPDGESTSSAKINTAETSTAQPSTAQLSTAQPPAETPSEKKSPEKKSPEKKSPEKTPAAVAAESAPQLPGGALELTPQPRLRTADRRPRLTPGAPEAGKPPVGVLPTATEPSARPAPSRQLELEAKRSSDESPVENVLRLGSEAERGPRPNMRGQSVELELSLEAPAAGGKADKKSADAAEQADRVAPSGEAKYQPSDASNELPDSLEGRVPPVQLQFDDLPLEQEEHPYDAPPAASGLAPSNAVPRRSLAPAVTQFTPRELQIQQEIQRCLHFYMTNLETTTRRGPWAMMHAALPFGVEAEVIAGNRRVNAIGWMSFNGVCAKQRMFQPTRTGFRPNVGPGMQGHEGQFLAILAQSSVRGDYPLQVGSRQYTVMDLAHYEMATCVEKSELTFKLIGLSHYLDQEQRWRDSRGHSWTLEKMVAEELAQPVLGAACGGTHRLMGLSYALLRRQAAGLPVTGHWERAEQYLNDYVNYAMTLQNPDGSFSTNWFESRGMDRDVERKVQTSGHILEWLVYTLPDDHLRSPKVQLGVQFLLDTVGRNPRGDWAIGPRGHALRALALYSQRVYGAEQGQLKAYVAQASNPARTRR